MTEHDLLPLYECLPNSPFRPVDWRWQLARSALAAGGPGPYARFVDDGVRRITRLLERAAALGGLAHPDLALLDTDLAAALAIRDDPGRGLRFAIETRILARQDDAAIAAATGVPVGVVAAYAESFYDARPRLDATDHVVAWIIGATWHRLLVEPDLEAYVQLDAYFGGPAYADLWLALLGSPPCLPEPDAPPGPFEPEVAADFRRLMAMRMLPVNESTHGRILRMYGLLRAARLQQEAEAGPDSNDPLAELRSLQDEIVHELHDRRGRSGAGDAGDDDLRATG